MASKYTGEAYAGMKPVEQGFGDVAMQALNVDLVLRAGEAERLKQQRLQAKADRERLDANLRRFDELATGALDLSPQAFDNQSLAVLVAETKNEIANMRRELLSPDLTMARESEIFVKIGNMKNQAASYMNQMKGWNTFLEGLAKTGKGGYDEILNADLLADIGTAIDGAAREGVKPLGNGAWSMGANIDFRTREGMIDYVMKGRNGEVLAAGSPSEVMAKLSARLRPYVDLQGMLDDAGKAVGNAVIQSFRRNPDGSVTTTSRTDRAYMAEQLGNMFDQRFGRTYETDPYMRKGQLSGLWDDEAEARRYFINNGLLMADNMVKQSLSNAGGGSGSGADRRAIVEPILDIIHGGMLGEPSAVQNLVGRRLSAYVPYNGRNVQAQIADIKHSNGLTTVTFMGRDENASTRYGEDKGYANPFEITFDVTTPDGTSRLATILRDAWNSEAETKEKLLESDMRNYFNFDVTPQVREEIRNERGEFVSYREMRPYLDELAIIAGEAKPGMSDEEQQRLTSEVQGVLDRANSDGVLPYEAKPEIRWWKNKMLLVDKDTGETVTTIDLSKKNFASNLVNALNEIASLSSGAGNETRRNPAFRRSAGQPVTGTGNGGANDTMSKLLN